MAVSEQQLEEFRNIMQKILDKYIPEEKRISVKNYSQEDLYDLASLLLEKDLKEREKLWEQIEKKLEKKIENFKKAEYDFLQENTKLQERKKAYDNIFNSIDELHLLAEKMSIDRDLENKLNEIF